MIFEDFGWQQSRLVPSSAAKIFFNGWLCLKICECTECSFFDSYSFVLIFNTSDGFYKKLALAVKEVDEDVCATSV